MTDLSSSSSGTEFKRRGRAERPALDAISMQKLFDRLPPHSMEAEKALLGSMILDPRVIGDAMAIVRSPSDFYHAGHAEIFRTILEVYDRQHMGELDLVPVNERLRDRGVLDQIGGSQYLVELAESVPVATHAVHYAKIVSEKARLRRLIDAAGKMIYDSYHLGDMGPEATKEVLETAEKAIFEIAHQGEINEPEVLSILIKREMDRIDARQNSGSAISGIATGYYELDRMLSGLQPGEMLILAARPSMGKTALALNLAENVAMGEGSGVRGGGTPTPVAVFSLEMSKASVTMRLLSGRASVSGHKLRGGSIDDDSYERLFDAYKQLASAPLFIDDSAGLTIMQLRARARRLKSKHDIKLIVVDYLQLLTAPGSRESRQIEVSEISRGIKALARDLEVPIVCLSQLNRASEQREGNRPRMSDLRESGSIEQDADVIMLLHREEYYHLQTPGWRDDPENQDKLGIAEIIIAKQRNGPTGVVKLRFDADLTRFFNYDPNAIPPGDAHQFHDNRGGDYESPPQQPPRRGGFPASRPTGPIQGHRDGGGPDSDRSPPPWSDEAL
ncbi:MAG: replicative DNA helicase [Planctomycetota bacterium]|nr:replicative DNA helicase [Planctomycetota bacterium]